MKKNNIWKVALIALILVSYPVLASDPIRITFTFRNIPENQKCGFEVRFGWSDGDGYFKLFDFMTWGDLSDSYGIKINSRENKRFYSFFDIVLGTNGKLNIFGVDTFERKNEENIVLWF